MLEGAIRGFGNCNARKSGHHSCDMTTIGFSGGWDYKKPTAGELKHEMSDQSLLQEPRSVKSGSFGDTQTTLYKGLMGTTFVMIQHFNIFVQDLLQVQG